MSWSFPGRVGQTQEPIDSLIGLLGTRPLASVMDAHYNQHDSSSRVYKQQLTTPTLLHGCRPMWALDISGPCCQTTSRTRTLSCRGSCCRSRGLSCTMQTTCLTLLTRLRRLLVSLTTMVMEGGEVPPWFSLVTLCLLLHQSAFPFLGSRPGASPQLSTLFAAGLAAGHVGSV